MAGHEGPLQSSRLIFGLASLGFLPLESRVLSTVVILLATILAIAGVTRLQVDDSLSELFRTDTPEFHRYEEIDRRFPSSEYDILVVIEGNRRRSIVVRMPEDLRADDEEIKKLPLRVGQSGLLPLGSVVDFKTLETVEPIRRDDGQRRAALMVNLAGRDVEGFVRDAEQRIREQVKLPENYIIEFGGQFKNLQEARTRLAVSR